jgi:hypothetical protein
MSLKQLGFGLARARVLKEILLHHRFNELTHEFTSAHVPELCIEC